MIVTTALLFNKTEKSRGKAIVVYKKGNDTTDSGISVKLNLKIK